MQSMAAQMLIVLLLFNALWLLFFVTRSHVPGYWLILSARFGAFKYYVFSWHN